MLQIWFNLLFEIKDANLLMEQLDLHSINKTWWLCLVPTSTTRFASEVGYRMAKNW